MAKIGFMASEEMSFENADDDQGWQSIDHPGKPRWENLGFPGLGNTPRNGSTGQYWVKRYFPPVFIMKYLKTACSLS